jgi:hypothetical protein
MRTIGRRRPSDSRGDYPALCDLCGVKWWRSQLSRGAGGLLVCPDDVGDTRVAAPPHIRNDYGTGGTVVTGYAEQSESVGVVL